MIPGRSWGASPAERSAALPCDSLDPTATIRCDRAVTVRAPAPAVFRWLCQLRVAPYSYDLLDNRGRPSPHALTPGLEQLAIGQQFMTMFRLASFALDDHVTLRSRRVSVTYAVRPDRAGCRLVGRVLFSPPGGLLGLVLIGHPLAVGDMMMMRKQLLTLKALAERATSRQVGAAAITATTPSS